MFWYSHLLKNFAKFVVIYIGKGFGIINKTEVEAMAPHYSTLAWKIPWMEEPGRL